jgi:predicted DNA-binding transcriptional regulator AlpA
MYRSGVDSGYMCMSEIAFWAKKNVRTIKIHTLLRGFPKPLKTSKKRLVWKVKDIEQHYNIKIG